jgi:hypothetical protein
MNKEQTIEAIKVMQAFVDGKEVVVKGMLAGSVWLPASAPCWNWQMMEYRIKPTPTLRPWTADEVPLGAWMRTKSDREYRFLISNTESFTGRDNWVEDFEHSTDKGVTWLPCGVMEEAK